MLIVKAIYYFFHCFVHYDPTTFSASNEVLNWQKNIKKQTIPIR